MKHTLFILTSVSILLASCSKEEGKATERLDPIVFGAAGAGVELTKAASALTSGSFNVYAWKTDLDTASTIPAAVLANPIYTGTKVTYSEEISAFVPAVENIKYWQDLVYYHFAAVNGLGSATPVFTCDDGRKLSMTVSDFSCAGADDFIYADFVADRQKGSGNVNFAFHHALSKIKFTVTLPDIPATVEASEASVSDIEYTISGISTTGTFSSSTSAWTSLSGTDEIVAQGETPVYLIPQTLGTSAIATLSCKLNVKYTSDPEHPAALALSKSFKLNAVEGGKWVSGDFVTYNLKINPVGGEIVFDSCTVASFETEDKNI